ncbi:MAG: glucosyl-3-phosphoglycerate synthase [Gammaproteobacteria bacterium]|nr:glucosyl-3-phosphoglycerate synthase [Gammaproteobacteria bacterium]
MSIEDWLDNNTFHHSQFSDLTALVEAKERAGLRISLCIPTLNEEQTIGKEIVILKSQLMDRYPVLDELAVIDSGSEDRTLEIASHFGADVYLSSEILPSQGFKRGKGENLWKAVHQLEGDIICYIDADISNIHPRFVYGLVAPLIQRQDIQYVKAFYDRPLAFSQGLRPGDGGRVTEILVRPLFSLFYPELTAIIQPLSGEYAVRRQVLETIPFPIGYGVETAHLLDVYHQYGLTAFAQTDLEQRVHRNRSIQALGKMSFGILQSFLSRAKSHGIVNDCQELSNIHRTFQVKDHSHEQLLTDIIEEERLPINTVAEYREKYGLDRSRAAAE